ncbi:YvrJ family protein [Sutcliffiella horikoshii]|uniref:YvrJ family protein n=1 Tax=Sutcliffiella horikoshii TaxID=79883 RepID=A0A1Y0CQG2_9BACI|nr:MULTISPECIES: YvrJ family protein [Bacillaceae]ART77244.1 YvrJ family protein [Sutcliffiella horikoshii]TYS59306.1 YvrJ family protein [Sutcliffiella horikoshii]TYS74216.1 YvrJ family protein [Sutcliffiella horikoshii]
MDQWWTWISEVGFPIVVTFYLLHRIEQKLEHVTKTLQQLPYQLSRETLPSRSIK